jgi:hypothetical protein
LICYTADNTSSNFGGVKRSEKYNWINKV